MALGMCEVWDMATYEAGFIYSAKLLLEVENDVAKLAKCGTRLAVNLLLLHMCLKNLIY